VTILISTPNRKPPHAQSTHRILIATFSLLLAAAPFATAQSTLTSTPASDVIAANTRLDLPDAPGALLMSDSSSSADASANSADPIEFSFGQDPAPTAPVARSAPSYTLHMQLVVGPNEIANPMSVGDKVVAGFKSSVSLFAATGWITTAGFEQLTNGRPNYGTNSTAFGKRFGAIVAHGVSNGVFTNSFFAPIYHQDPRYYIMGPGHPFFKRILYAGTRCIISRTDSGKTIPNFALISGDAAGAALTILYYPSINTTTTEVLSSLGTSLGGSAFGYVVNEFLVDALIDLHLKKSQQP
jgi:hypothetical protein